MKSPGRNPGDKANQKALDKGECEEFELSLQHKSKLYVPFRYPWIFEELSRHANSDGSQEWPTCGACKASVTLLLE